MIPTRPRIGAKTPRARSRLPPDGPLSFRSLLDKYEALVHRYTALQERNAERVAFESAARVFAIAAEQLPVAGVALFYRGAIEARNQWLRRLDHRRTGWRPIAGGATALGVDGVVLSVAGSLGGSRGAAESVVERWERLRAEQTIDVRLERVGPGHVEEGALVLVTVLDVTERLRTSQQADAARRAAIECDRLRRAASHASQVARELGDALAAIREGMARLAHNDALSPEDRRAIEALARIASDAAARASDVDDGSPSASNPF